VTAARRSFCVLYKPIDPNLVHDVYKVDVNSNVVSVKQMKFLLNSEQKVNYISEDPLL
jgi:hypothetical protein